MEQRRFPSDGDGENARTPGLKAARRRRVLELAADQHGIVSRPQVYALGISRHEVRANVSAGRWQRLGSQSIAVFTGEPGLRSREWAAVFEAGPRAQLDGASSLVASGLEHFQTEQLRVSVPRGARVRRSAGLEIRQTRRWRADDLATGGVPRTRVEVAAVRAALWAHSDKQAALLLSMTVEQGLTTAERIAKEFLRVRRDRRRMFIQSVLVDLLGGVRSLGELEFARECRARGLPEPTRQVLRRGRHGRYYLDVVWEEWDVVVEIDGIQHGWATHLVSDALRHNDVTLAHATVLRLPLLGLRVDPDGFFEQITRALAKAGCPLGGTRSA